mmetsp:Transcript_61209/g.75048  ORF Transcript_61209/g.75048 Transcript_61209/m.75048 type:complete len:98 (+) Transcript_61209:78-371(+)
MFLPRLLICLGIALCGALGASCESEHTSLIQDSASHANQRALTEEQREKSEHKVDAPRKVGSTLQLGSAVSSKEAKAKAEHAKRAMADWIARDLKSF